MRDPYSVLHVAPQASNAEIKSAFRSLAKACHPDVRPGDREAEQTFQEARRAYQLLSNPETRKAYDDFLASRRAAERARRRRAAKTMSASFLLTAATVMLVALWIQQGDLSMARAFSTAVGRAGAHEMARVRVEAEASTAARLPTGRTEAVAATPARP